MNSHLPAGRVAAHLDALPKTQARLAIITAIAALMVADYHIREIGLTPLYIPIICAASWTLGPRTGYGLALLTAILGILPHLNDEAHHTLAIIAAREGVHLTTYLFIASIIASFRRSFDRERFLALRDRMTGAFNKEAFNEQAAPLIEAAARAGEMLLLAILDLDDFKAVNTDHGHAAGDAILRAFGQGAAATIRRQDMFGRIGGDEFAFLIPVHSAEEGRRFAVTLHSRLSAVLASVAHPVTCSMGALLIPPDALRSAGELMHVADLAMYQVKQSGKNAVHIGEVRVPARLAAGKARSLQEQLA